MSTGKPWEQDTSVNIPLEEIGAFYDRGEAQEPAQDPHEMEKCGIRPQYDDWYGIDLQRA